MTPMKIGYSKVLAIIEIVTGALLMAVSLPTQTWVGVFAGAILVLLGILMVVNSILRIEAQQVQVRNPVGMVLKRYPIESASDLYFEGNTLWHRPQNKKVASLGFGAQTSDVESLRSSLAESR